MALAPKQNQVPEAAGGGGRVHVTDNSPQAVILLRNYISQLIWESNKRIMSIAEIAVIDERIWKLVRGQMLDEFNKTEKAYKQLINTLLIQEQGEEGNPEVK